jgi:hypothetical protein
MKNYRPENLILFRIFCGHFSSQIYQPIYPLFINGNMKSYQPGKIILFRIFWDIFSSQIYQPIYPLFINIKCEKLSTQKANFINNIYGIFLTL